MGGVCQVRGEEEMRPASWAKKETRSMMLIVSREAIKCYFFPVAVAFAVAASMIALKRGSFFAISKTAC